MKYLIGSVLIVVLIFSKADTPPKTESIVLNQYYKEYKNYGQGNCEFQYWDSYKIKKGNLK